MSKISSNILKLGRKTAEDISLTIDNGTATLPEIKYDNAAGNFKFSNDGTNFFDFGSGSEKPSSEIVAYTGAGHGSTNTNIRRMTGSTVIGTDITFADSSTDGCSFTINKDGIYSVSYSDRVQSGGSSAIGISLNATGGDLTSSISTLQPVSGVGIAHATTPSSTFAANVAITKRFSAGDIIRPHTDGNPDSTIEICTMSVTQIVVL